MARRGRMFSETGIYHVVLRGINKKDIFECDEDKIYFLKLLSKNIKKFHGEVFAFCVMRNHIHILVKEGIKGISNLFQRIAGAYAIYFNRKYARSGPLFESRFKSRPVESIYYFFQIIRYIHQNPFHAGLIKNLEDYDWSSYSTYLRSNNKKIFDFVCTDFVFQHVTLDAFVDFNHQFSKSAAMKHLSCLWPIRISDNTVYEIAQNYLAQFGESLEFKTEQILEKLVQYLVKIAGITKMQISRLLKLSPFQLKKILENES